MAEGGPPDLATQKQLIEGYLSRNMNKGELWYLVDIWWFKQWKKYVGYDHWDTFSVGDEAVHPGPIDNCSLFKPGSTILREHLVDYLDYMLLPDEAYKKLASWYGEAPGQEPIIRKVIEQGMFVKILMVEVYFIELKLCENSDPTTGITRAFSRLDTIATIEQEMRQQFSIPEEKEVRLWNRYMRNTFEQINKKDVTLQDAGLYQGQVIVIEAKNDDGTWPRQYERYYTYSSASCNTRNVTLFNAREVDPPEVTARMDSEIVKNILSMDVPKKMVKKAIRKRLAENHEDFTSAEALLEAVFRDSEDVPKAWLSKLAKRDQSATATGDSESPDSMRLVEEIRELKEQKLCKICMDEEVCVTFIPCGHLVSCSTCAPAHNQCPICRANIQGIIRTYMS